MSEELKALEYLIQCLEVDVPPQDLELIMNNQIKTLKRALKRNEPTTVIVERFNDATDSRNYYCGSCSWYITSGKLDNIDCTITENIFCKHCGKRLQWEAK